MKAIKDWIACQLSSKPLPSSRTPSGDDSFVDEPLNEQLGNTDPCSLSGTGDRLDECCLPPFAASGSSYLPLSNIGNRNGDTLTLLEALQIKFLRLIYRLSLPAENVVVSQVLYRLQLAGAIQAGSPESRSFLRSDRAKAIAWELESTGKVDLEFSITILVLGKTGVGKSATINSIFGQAKTKTDAFQPSTTNIQEIVGMVNGIKVKVIDTPGLSPSSFSYRRNRKILLSVKRFIKKSRPDIVLYFDRLDAIHMGSGDFALLKLITENFGPAMWFNTILVMTHSSNILEGPDGYQVVYDSFANQCTNQIQHYISMTVGDTQLMNPVLLVENHPFCRTNIKGEKVLPNGQVWKNQFLLLTVSSKVLGDANAILKFKFSTGGRKAYRRVPSLPHLLSSLLQPHPASKMQVMSCYEEVEELVDPEEEDEYDKLPPIRLLTKAQFEKLSKSQKKDYHDELDYRETLYLRKQWREEFKRQTSRRASSKEPSAVDENGEADIPPDAFPLPDMAIPQSFGSDSPAYRYRFLDSNSKWFMRPILDSQGWDHDIGFDGVNLEASLVSKDHIHALLVGQMNKGKQDFSFQTECTAACMTENGQSFYGGLDVQAGNESLLCTVRGDAKFKTLKHNKIGGAVSLTSLGRNLFLGAKLSDSLLIARRLKLVLNAGAIGGHGEMASGGSLEVSLRGRDFPVRNERGSLALTLLSYDKEMIYGGSLQADFRPSHGTNMSVQVNVNSRQMGQACIKVSSSEHVQFALLVVIPIVRALFRRKEEPQRVV